MNLHRLIAILPIYSFNLLNHRIHYASASLKKSLGIIIKNTVQTNSYNLPEMKKIILSSIAICMTILLCAAGFNDAFVQRQTEKGWLFHIFSQKMPSIDKKSKELKYDYTYLQQTDSVTMLASMVTKSPFTPDSLLITYCGRTYSAPAELIYLTPGKNKFDIRIKASIPYQIWYDIYSCADPFKVQYTIRGGDSSDTYSFGYNSKKWKSNRDRNFTIINSIKINTGK